MSTLTIAITVIWVVFWIYWLISAAGAKRSSSRRRTRPPGLFIAILVLLVLHAFKLGSLAVDDPAVQIVGAILFLAGLGLAVWARIYLGRNWGMPMTQKHEPELVTSGPYRYVRHPIYSGFLLATLGTALATSLYWLLGVVILGVYFIHSAMVEEKLMTASFPAAYPGYKTRTKMLIPFVL
ncbi:MAG TPA: isoprenylcysteine carboxylmethyltransferase family protein [Solirubrobacteraceae bacterium]|nr:isoprenylcysteine carboxylmethyltransferase family protein [Solirubrobacteraceae bacterium]